jgi:tetratricopeptide (TPR) repeat protein
MTLSLHLHNPFFRTIWLLVTLALAGLLIGLALTRFATATLANPRYVVEFSLLEQIAAYFPHNAPLQGRVATELIDAHWANAQDYQQAADDIVRYATRAAALAPWNYEYPLLAAHGYEAKGDLAAAAASLREALRLAPSHTTVHWQYANLLLRQNALDDSLNSFRLVLREQPEKMPVVFQMLWQASGGQAAKLQALAEGAPAIQLPVAQYLCTQKQYGQAAETFSQLEPATVLASPTGGQVLDALIAAGQWEMAAMLWQRLFPQTETNATALLRNGSWERTARKGWTQFDWNIQPNKFARIGVVAGEAHAGSNSLQLVYQKVDTTNLAGAVQQLALVQAGGRYQLTGFAKAEALQTPDALQWAVLRADNKAVLATTDAVAPGTHDWQSLSLSFTVPDEVRAVYVVVKQTPQFKYSEPSSGTVWFDDLALRAVY